VIATRIVLVTTTSAKEIVEAVVQELLSNYDDLELSVIVTSAPVASLATTDSILSDLLNQRELIKDVDLIVLPGLIRGSAEKLKEILGVPVVKGPKYVGDLHKMVDLLRRGVRFSTEVPADDIIAMNSRERLGHLLESIKRVKPRFKARDVLFTLRPPPLNLFYELCPSTFTNCGLRRLKDFNTLIASLAKLGYSGVVIGCDVEEGCYDDLRERLMSIRRHGLLAGIDVYDLSEVPKDILELVDLVLNVTARDVEIIASHANKDIILVLVPEETSSLKSALNSIAKTIRLAEDAGFKKIIVDPVLRPPMLGLAKSLRFLGEAISSMEYPFLAGLCNVYELMDADSPGVVALLTTLLFEIGVSNLLITEASRKACGAAEEAAYARMMVYEAFVRRSPPKDTLYNLLILKDKRKREVPPKRMENIIRRKIVKEPVPPRIENVYVKLYVNRETQRIIVDVYVSDKIVRYEGKNPLDLGRAIVRELGLSAEHAMYLGFELSKAYLALRTAKDYIQDEELFIWSGYVNSEFEIR